jgi:hypothetical protein
MNRTHSELGRFVLVQRAPTLHVADRRETQLDPREILDQGAVVLAGMTLAQARKQSRVDLDARR